MSKLTLYPWQINLWDKFSSTQSRMPHAILLRGRAGIGKSVFANYLAKSLLCNEKGIHHQLCGACPSCNWFDLGNHPDYKLLTPVQEDENTEEQVTSSKKSGKKSSQILIGQVKALASFFELSSHQMHGARVVLIEPAEALNIASSNSLLKMLEEPPTGVVFILISNQSDRLLPTIISRCQVIDMPLPDRASAIEWLKAQGVSQPDLKLDYTSGSPLKALEQTTEIDLSNVLLKHLALGSKIDPFFAAPQFVNQGMEVAINVIQKWVHDMLTIKLTGQLRYHTGLSNALQGLSKSVNLQQLLSFQSQLDEYKKSSNHPLSNEMQIENLLVQYTRIFQ